MVTKVFKETTSAIQRAMSNGPHDEMNSVVSGGLVSPTGLAGESRHAGESMMQKKANRNLVINKQ